MNQRIKALLLASIVFMAPSLTAAPPGGGAPKPPAAPKPTMVPTKPGVPPGTTPPSGPKPPGTPSPPSSGPRAPLPPQTPGKPGVPPQTPGKPGVPSDPRAPLPASPKPTAETCVPRPVVTGDQDSGCRGRNEGAHCGPMTITCKCFTRNTSRECAYTGGSRQSPGICKTSQSVLLCESAGNQTWLDEATAFCANQTCGPIIR
jgi:hypothetical protein